MKYSIIMSGFVLLFLVESCKDILETNISGRTVVTLAPGDNVKTIYSTQTFCWEQTPDALWYELQIVTPSFAAVGKLMMDTIISTTNFSMALFPGTFEWRVKALNGSSQTPYTLVHLEIDSTQSLSGQSVILHPATANGYTNLKNLTLQWDNVYNATNYTVTVDQITTDGQKTTIYSRVGVTRDTITILGIPEGSYQWGVKALNNKDETQIFTQTFTVDYTAPAIPQLLTPVNKTTITQTSVTLKWKNIAVDTGAPLFDSVYVCADTSFTMNKIVKKYKIEAGVDSLKDDFVVGEYYWDVKTIDKAGNKSILNPQWLKFIRQN